MTEAEWLACGDAEAMLSFVERRHKAARTNAGRRKLRLFGIGCVRSYVEHSAAKGEEDIEVQREAIAIAERFADGLADKDDLARIREKLRLAGHTHGTAQSMVSDRAQDARVASRQYYIGDPTWPYEATDQRRAQMMREIFGNPFRRLPNPAAWRKWSGGAILKLAHAAYEERILPAGTLDPVRLTVLADALEDAGCTDADILGHCRGPGPHVRGCWVVDLLLGKQ
jgi:hypothetical protein